MRLSMTSYLRFLLLSFSLSCPTLYGGLPMMTLMSAAFWRSTRSVLASVRKVIWRSRARSSVSTKQSPSKGAARPVSS